MIDKYFLKTGGILQWTARKSPENCWGSSRWNLEGVPQRRSLGNLPKTHLKKKKSLKYCDISGEVFSNDSFEQFFKKSLHIFFSKECLIVHSNYWNTFNGMNLWIIFLYLSEKIYKKCQDKLPEVFSPNRISFRSSSGIPGESPSENLENPRGSLKKFKEKHTNKSLQ